MNSKVMGNAREVTNRVIIILYGGHGPRKKFVRRMGVAAIPIPHVKLLKKSELPDIALITAKIAKPKMWAISRISKHLGFASGTSLTRALVLRDVRVSMLIALSTLLGTNLLEHYRKLLPENIRDTPEEVALKSEVEALKKELESVKAERDKYWDALARK